MIISLMGAMAFAAGAQAAQTARTTGWRLQADPALCVLERRNAEPPVTLSIETIPGSDDYRLAIAAPAIKKSAALAPASLTFAPSQKTRNGRARVGKLPDGTPVMWMENVSPGLLDELSGAETVTMAIGSRERVLVQVASSAKAVEALRRCNADQLLEWGADAGQFAPGGTAPVAVKNREEWLSKGELLKVMGEARRPDVDETFRVAVSADGVVDDCHAVHDKAEKGMEDAACAPVLGKALFTPARDAGGHPVRGVATFRVRLASRPY